MEKIQRKNGLSNAPRILMAGFHGDDLASILRCFSGRDFEIECEDSPLEVAGRIVSGPFQLILLDLSIPGGDGIIDLVARNHPEMIIVVVAHPRDFFPVAVALREHKAYDFVLRPFHEKDLLETVDRALKIGHFREVGLTFFDREKQHYEQLLETFDWKREIGARHRDRFTVPMLLELNRVLFQGGGAGVLLTALELIFETDGQEGKKYEIEGEILNILRESTIELRKLSRCILAATEILARVRPVRERSPLSVVCKAALEIARELAPAFLKNGRRLVLGPVRGDLSRTILWEPASFRTILVELLINAAKYSRQGDVLYLLFADSDSCFDLKVINPAYSGNSLLPLDEESEAFAFTPFFRLARGEAEAYPQEEFGFGLGLTVVRKLVELHQAHVSLTRIKNYVRNDQFNDICATVRFPVEQAQVLRQQPDFLASRSPSPVRENVLL